MKGWTDLQLVLRMRGEAAEILRKHSEATSRGVVAYAAATRQVENLRESLRQTAKEVTALTGTVRVAGNGAADGVASEASISAAVADLATGIAAATKAAQGQAASSAKDDRRIIGRRSGQVDRAAEVDGGRDGLPARRQRSPDGRVSADIAAFLAEMAARGVSATAGRREHAGEHPGAVDPEGRRDTPASRLERATSVVAPNRLAPSFHPKDARSIEQLRAAFEAALRTQALLLVSPRTGFGSQDLDLLNAVLERSRSAPLPKRSTVPEVPADPSAPPAGGTTVGHALPSAGIVPDPRTPEAPLRFHTEDVPSVTAIAAGRRELIAEIREAFASFRREMRKANVRDGERPETVRETTNEARALELLRVEVRRLVPAGRAIEDVATDQATWLQGHRTEVAETAGSRRPPAVAVPKGFGSDGGRNPIGAYLQDVTADWRAYGNGLANALGATEQVLSGILTQTRDWRSAMHSLIKSVVSDFARIAIRQNVTGPLADAIVGAGGKGGDGGLLGRALGWITSLFAGGGIMTAHGPLPLRTYASGGIATSPQLALFGEGSTPEAYVPVPNGRIPVTLRGSTGVGSIATNIVINVTAGGNAADPAVGSNPADLARNIGALVTAAFNRNLAEQMRPGGMLNPAGYLGNGLAH